MAPILSDIKKDLIKCLERSERMGDPQIRDMLLRPFLPVEKEGLEKDRHRGNMQVDLRVIIDWAARVGGSDGLDKIIKEAIPLVNDQAIENELKEILAKVTVVQKVDIAILTVLQEEYQAIRNRLVNSRPAPSSVSDPNLYAWKLGQIPYRNTGKSYSVALGMSGKAGSNAGVLATIEAINRWSPEYIFFVGIAGGFNKDNLNKGDVVISKLIYGYEYGKLEKEFKPRDDLVFHPYQGLVTGALEFDSSYTNWTSDIQITPPVESATKMLPGNIASGDKIVDDINNEFFKQVKAKWPEILAVEMEGAGVAAAIEQARSKFLMIRGISDMPRSEDTGTESGGTQERDAWTTYAAHTAAVFTVSFIANSLPIPPKNL